MRQDNSIFLYIHCRFYLNYFVFNCLRYDYPHQKTGLMGTLSPFFYPLALDFSSNLVQVGGIKMNEKQYTLAQAI